MPYTPQGPRTPTPAEQWPRRFRILEEGPKTIEVFAQGCMWSDCTSAARPVGSGTTVVYEDISTLYSELIGSPRRQLDFIDGPGAPQPTPGPATDPRLLAHPTRFELQRLHDATGVSGTGCVASGAVFNDGHAVMRWLTATSSTALYDSIKDVQEIHGHHGATRVVLVDPWYVKEPIMAMSRKHYRQAAAVIKRAHQAADTLQERSLVGVLADDFASMFKQDNAAFSRQRFFDAVFGEDQAA